MQNDERRTSNIEHPIKVEKTYDLEERLLKYSTRILELVAKLPKTMEYLHISNQLMRSGTSVYPNHAEAQSAESVAGFIQKNKLNL